ncbi:MAG TPA: carbohydrate kinase family protein [Candidatus Acidoferrum sp.]|nr:carbohydrate kinase family protein [Candidatus Acidoferrum sp.]
MPPQVVGIGSCGIDYFAIVPRLLGADQKINADRMEIHAGGVTGNNLTQVARLGASAGWLGLIGDDESGRLITQAFADDGLDLSGMETISGEQSTFTWIPVDAQGERCIYMFPNVNGKLTAEQVTRRFAPHIKSAKHFHTEASQLPLPPIQAAMQVARDAGVRVIFDLDVAPSYFAHAKLGSESDLISSLQLVDVLKPCKAAAREITGETDFEKMALKLLALGPKVVAVTMGAEGAIIAGAGKMTHVPPLQVNVVDSTGAGDAFMGGLSYGLLQGWEHRQVGLFANACAAICCTKVGARAMGNRTEVVALLKSQRAADAAAF